MATYSDEHFESMKGETSMNEGLGLGAGAVGGLIVGGLAGYALSQNNRNDNNWGHNGCAPVVGCGGFSQAEVDNLVATKNAEIAQMASTTLIIDKIQDSNLGLTKGLCASEYQNMVNFSELKLQGAQSNAALALQIEKNRCEAELCCCKTQGMITASNQDLKNFYLTDELTELRLEKLTKAQHDQINIINTNVNAIGSTVNTLAEIVKSKIVA